MVLYLDRAACSRLSSGRMARVCRRPVHVVGDAYVIAMNCRLRVIKDPKNLAEWNQRKLMEVMDYIPPAPKRDSALSAAFALTLILVLLAVAFAGLVWWDTHR